MLIRLVLLVVLAVVSFMAARRLFRPSSADLVRLTKDELAVLRSYAKDIPAAAEALDARDRIYALPGAESDDDLVADVERAQVELLHLITLHRGLDRTAKELFTDENARALVRATAEARSATDEDDRAVAAREQETLERQRAARDRLVEKAQDLERDMRELSLGLRDLHVAVVELSATQGGLKNADTRGAATKLRETSDELRRRAEAFTSIESLLKTAEAEAAPAKREDT